MKECVLLRIKSEFDLMVPIVETMLFGKVTNLFHSA